MKGMWVWAKSISSNQPGTQLNPHRDSKKEFKKEDENTKNEIYLKLLL